MDIFSPETAYNKAFFANISGGSAISAQIISPIAMELAQPTSIVDVGCGTGEWLQAFHNLGVIDYLGIDGEYAQSSELKISHDHLLSMDLCQPKPISRTFDLAISLEVAEHLPKSTSISFINYLTDLAPIILFSAAMPGQGGTHHINEQWPWYWQQLFLNRGYMSFDAIRPRIWQNPDVKWWYRQNIFLYVRQDISANCPSRFGPLPIQDNIFDTLHIVSEGVIRNLTSARHGFRKLLCELPYAAWHSFINRITGK